MRVDLLQLRESRYQFGKRWYEWVLVDVDAGEVVGFFAKRHDAEREMERLLEEDE